MKKRARTYVLYSIVGLVICLALFAFVKVSVPFYSSGHFFDQSEQNIAEPVLASFEPGLQSTDHALNIEHITIKWSNSEKWAFRKNLIPSLPEEQDLLITIEMWEKARLGLSRRNMLQATLNGDYDQKILALSRAIADKPQQVFVRWNPEMEVPASQYPWQKQLPRQYIPAFRHFASLLKEHAPNVRVVWGPAGYPGTLEYWPGSDVADYISISLKSQSELQTSAYPQTDSMPELIKRKLHRIRFTDKPVLLIGSEKVNKDNYREEWLQMAVTEIQKAKKDIGPAYNIASEPDPEFKKKNREANAGLRLGVYDPKQQLTDQRPVSIEHLFTGLSEIESGRFKQKFDSVIYRGHDVIVTVEPWGHGNESHSNPEVNPLIETLKGEYDAEIEKLYQVIADAGQTVYLRFAHEMEIPIERYPWQSRDPVLYIKAYRYFTTYKKPLPENIRLVWGPAGDRGSLEWWPGSDVVDYISIAVYGLPDKNIHNHEEQESFSTIVDRKLHRMRFADKPVFITEFGVKGPDDFQKNWLEDAAQTINASPEITGVCYFNLYDNPEVWGEGEAPDWGISEDTFIYFSEVLEE